MILLYTALLLVLVVVKFLIDRRVARLERKYAQAAESADRLLLQIGFKQGNSSRLDPCQQAKRQFQLGQLVQKRDRLEAKHEAWASRAEKFGRCVAHVRDWKGKKLPYTLGLVDMSFLMWLVDYLGAGEYLSAESLIASVTALMQ